MWKGHRLLFIKHLKEGILAVLQMSVSRRTVLQ